MSVGPVNNSGKLQFQLARNSAGEPKHISELFSEIYSEDEREAIADRYLEFVNSMETSRELSVEKAIESVGKYKSKIEHYTSLLQTQSYDQPAETIKNKIQEYKTYLNNYQSQLDYYRAHPIEDDEVRNHLFKMTASMLGLSTQEVVQDYEAGGEIRKR